MLNSAEWMILEYLHSLFNFNTFFFFSSYCDFLKLEKFGKVPVIKLNQDIKNLLYTSKPGRILKRHRTAKREIHKTLNISM